MEFRVIVKKTVVSNYFPFKHEVSDFMKPSVLLLCKLMFLLLLAHGFLKVIDDPYIPFIKSFDWFLQYPNVFKLINRGFFCIAGILLIFNIKIRLMCLILGLVIFLNQFASIPEFANHYFICGCVFLLSGLINKRSIQLFLAIQLSLIYLGASINKISQSDWWSGDFIYNWLVNARENVFFINLSELFPDMWLAKVFSWSSIIIEITIGILILNRKTQHKAIWILILFHALLYTLTAFRFGHFYEDLLLLLLAFINFPKEKINVEFKNGILNSILICLNSSSVKEVFIWNEFKAKKRYWLKIVIDKKEIFNFVALRYLLLHSLNFYALLFFLDLLVRFLFNGITMDLIHITLTWIGILFFLPLLVMSRKEAIDI